MYRLHKRIVVISNCLNFMMMNVAMTMQEYMSKIMRH